MTAVLCLFIVSFLAYANGANDNFKGVATLFGSGKTSFSRALAWGTLATFLGSLTAVFFAQKLLAAFSGAGLVPAEVSAMKSYALAVGLGGALTVALATRLGFPISTTHALTGGLVGAGLVAAPGGVNFAILGSKFFLPLIVSPLLALGLAATVYGGIIVFRREAAAPVMAGVGGDASVLTGGGWAERTGDGLHFLSAGVVCFARALNDTPKMAALLLVGAALSGTVAIALLAIAMVVGGLLHSRRVAETMAHKVTRLDPVQGLCANLVTGFLVIFASRWGVPVSTTHVSCGSLFGIGTVSRQASLKTIVSILIAWITTLPVGAAFAALLFVVLRNWIG